MGQGTLTATTLTSEQFYAARDAWQQLLARSDGDPLFNSWHWAATWWRIAVERGADNANLRVYVVSDAQTGEWRAAAACHLVAHKTGFIRSHQLHLLGSGYSGGNLFRAEYRSVLVDDDDDGRASSALVDAIATDTSWDEWYVGDTPTNTRFFQHYRTLLPSNWFVREINQDIGYQVQLDDGFDAYLKQLSGSARRQIFNKRKRLTQNASGRIDMAPQCSLEQAISALNRFHQARWKHNVVNDYQRDFIERLTDDPEGPRLAHSLLLAGDQAIASLLDIDCGGRRYNVQLGFDEQFDKALSPGVLHLGYGIENAHACGLHAYDFLIGQGQSQNYKERFATRQIETASLHIVRSRWLRWLHVLYQRLRGAR